MVKKKRLDVSVVVDSVILLDGLKGILDGLETYKQHKNMAYLKAKVKDLIADIENVESMKRDTIRNLKVVGRWER